MEAVATPLRAAGAVAELVTVDDLHPADIVLVDSYAVRADELDTSCSALAAIDDLHRDLRVDLVVDPNPGASRDAKGISRTVLTGLDYALVQPLPSGIQPRAVGGTVERLIVATGASDAEGRGAELAEAIRDALPDVEVRLAVGPWGSNRVPNGVAAISTMTGLLPELAAADLVVTAGGVTLVESLLLGRPTIALTLAANQHRAVAGIAAAGGAVGMPEGTSSAIVVRSVIELARDPSVRQELSRKGAELVDGRGPQRVAGALLGLL